MSIHIVHPSPTRSAPLPPGAFIESPLPSPVKRPHLQPCVTLETGEPDARTHDSLAHSLFQRAQNQLRGQTEKHDNEHAVRESQKNHGVSDAGTRSFHPTEPRSYEPSWSFNYSHSHSQSSRSTSPSATQDPSLSSNSSPSATTPPPLLLHSRFYPKPKPQSNPTPEPQFPTTVAALHTSIHGLRAELRTREANLAALRTCRKRVAQEPFLTWAGKSSERYLGGWAVCGGGEFRRKSVMGDVRERLGSQCEGANEGQEEDHEGFPIATAASAGADAEVCVGVDADEGMKHADKTLAASSSVERRFARRSRSSQSKASATGSAILKSLVGAVRPGRAKAKERVVVQEEQETVPKDADVVRESETVSVKETEAAKKWGVVKESDGAMELVADAEVDVAVEETKADMELEADLQESEVVNAPEIATEWDVATEIESSVATESHVAPESNVAAATATNVYTTTDAYTSTDSTSIF
ncbi:hypothetical protein BDV95DRAFT_597377 [Massariosphaeria phaeospora]|uniref:Uncharacterized protein n=1 Tax=Massariosphaeria phaeospora TaxID=100035 RepID=A0A7C8I1Q5_9PLEO|nr:hypothetical protein BDV95DRAFT_597377 [Massariosphaeria phaeospora]